MMYITATTNTTETAVPEHQLLSQYLPRGCKIHPTQPDIKRNDSKPLHPGEDLMQVHRRVAVLVVILARVPSPSWPDYVEPGMYIC